MRSITVFSRRMTPMEIYLQEKANLEKLLKDTLPDINRNRYNLLAQVIARLAGHKELLKEGHYSLQFSDMHMALFLNISFKQEYALQLVETLNRLYPTLNAAFVMEGPSSIDQTITVSVIGFHPLSVSQTFIPLLKDYLDSNQDILNSSKYSTATLIDNFALIFEKYGIITRNTDIAEETTLAVVRANLKWNNYKIKQFYRYLVEARKFPEALLTALAKFLPGAPEYITETSPSIAAEIITANSMFGPHPQKPDFTQIQITTSLKASQHVAHYLNYILANSAIVEPARIVNPERNCEMTVITVNNRVLLSQPFLKILDDALHTYTQAQLDAYRVQSNSIDHPVSAYTEKLKNLHAKCLELMKNDIPSIGIKKLLENLNILIKHLSQPNFKFDLNTKIEEPKIVEMKDDEDEKCSQVTTPAPSSQSAEVVSILNDLNNEKTNIFGSETNHWCPHHGQQFFRELSPLKQELFTLFIIVENLLNIANNKYTMQGMRI